MLDMTLASEGPLLDMNFRQAYLNSLWFCHICSSWHFLYLMLARFDNVLVSLQVMTRLHSQMTDLKQPRNFGWKCFVWPGAQIP